MGRMKELQLLKELTQTLVKKDGLTHSNKANEYIKNFIIKYGP